MKTTNKTLAKKHFRYLSKKEIKDPLSILIDLYEDQTDFETFRLEVDLLLLGGLDRRLQRNGFDHHYTGQRLKRQIEVAYILYVEMLIKEKVNYNPHAKNIRETYAILNRNRIYDTQEALFLFFGYRSLAGWRNDVDDILSQASFVLNDYPRSPMDDCLILYHYLTTLVDTLHHIYKDGGVEIALPSYVKLKDSSD